MAPETSPLRRSEACHTGRVLPPRRQTKQALDQPHHPARRYQSSTFIEPCRPWHIHVSSGHRHITMPFNLRDDLAVVAGSEAYRRMFDEVFPGNTGNSIHQFFLFVIFRDLPPTPWPLTFAGIPVMFTRNVFGNMGPMTKGLFVPSRQGHIATNIQGKSLADGAPLFRAIRDHFARLTIPITEVIYWQNFFQIVLDDTVQDTEHLPQTAGGLTCLYLHESDMKRPAAQYGTMRTAAPAEGNPDETCYGTLRPGVRVSTARRPDPASSGQCISSTTGILVRNVQGEAFMTVAAHGFPDTFGIDVYHPFQATPEQPGRHIGTLVGRVGETDVGLVRLDAGETFDNEAFLSEDISETRLQRLARPNSLRAGDIVWLDSPETGYMEGLPMATSWRLPAELGKENQWFQSVWAYTGRGNGSAFAGSMCGTPICSKEGDVLALFRYAFKEGMWEDWSIGISMEELLSRGYYLASRH